MKIVEIVRHAAEQKWNRILENQLEITESNTTGKEA